VWSLAYSNGEGGVLVSGGADCTVRLWAGREDEQPGAEAWRPLGRWPTKETPVVALRFTTRNLLLGAGALSLRRPREVYQLPL
jgi:transcription initiation factor TFIID subunit 5